MDEIRKDCFAYKEVSQQPMCNSLKKLDCKDCPFYKNRKEVKNNIFYEWSFPSHGDYIRELEKYSSKYGIGHLEEFEEDEED